MGCLLSKPSCSARDGRVGAGDCVQGLVEDLEGSWVCWSVLQRGREEDPQAGRDLTNVVEGGMHSDGGESAEAMDGACGDGVPGGKGCDCGGGPPLLSWHPKDKLCVSCGEMVQFSTRSDDPVGLWYRWQRHPNPNLKSTMGKAAADLLQKKTATLARGLDPAGLTTELLSLAVINYDTAERVQLPDIRSNKCTTLLQSLHKWVQTHPCRFVEVCDILKGLGANEASSMKVEFETLTAQEEEKWQNIVEEAGRISGTTLQTLTIVRVQGSDTGSLRCVVTNQQNMSAISDIAVLTVSLPRVSSKPLPVPPTLTSHLETIIESPRSPGTALPVPSPRSQAPSSEPESNILEELETELAQGIGQLKAAVLEYKSGDKGTQQRVLLALLHLSRDVSSVVEAALDYGFPATKNFLHLCCQRSLGNTTSMLLNRREIDINITTVDENEETPLHCACRSASPEVVQLLLKFWPHSSMNAVNKKKHMALHVACFRGDVNVVNLLLRKYGASVVTAMQSEDIHGNTPIHLACLADSYETVRVLLKTKECKLDALNKELKLPLHIAVEKCNPGIVRKLLRYNSKVVDQTDRNHDTPLHIACRNGSPESLQIVKLLMAKKASTTLQNLMKCTPLDLAEAYGHKDILRALGGKSFHVLRRQNSLDRFEEAYHLKRSHPANRTI